MGFSGASRIPYGIGLVKNKYIGRTFISPGQDERFDQLRIKLNPVNHVIAGKRVVLIDDSIVRGTTSRRIVMLLREAGAKEIHMRISAPPFLHPCFYGTDIDSEENLIASRHSMEEIAGLIGVDTLHKPKVFIYALSATAFSPQHRQSVMDDNPIPALVSPPHRFRRHCQVLPGRSWIYSQKSG